MNSGRAVLWGVVVSGLLIAALIESWEVVGSAAGSGGTFASRTQGGARSQTAEADSQSRRIRSSAWI
jgi:hypothetical protein